MAGRGVSRDPPGQTPQERQDCRGRPLDHTEPRSRQNQPQAENQLDNEKRAQGQGWREDGKQKHNYLEALQGGELGADRDDGQDRNKLVQQDRDKATSPPQSIKAGTHWEKGQEWQKRGNRPGETLDEANKTNVEHWRVNIEEMRGSQDRLTGATAALLMAVREAGSRPP